MALGRNKTSKDLKPKKNEYKTKKNFKKTGNFIAFRPENIGHFACQK
jgi:hypothetical protein